MRSFRLKLHRSPATPVTHVTGEVLSPETTPVTPATPVTHVTGEVLSPETTPVTQTTPVTHVTGEVLSPEEPFFSGAYELSDQALQSACPYPCGLPLLQEVPRPSGSDGTRLSAIFWVLLSNKIPGSSKNQPTGHVLRKPCEYRCHHKNLSLGGPRSDRRAHRNPDVLLPLSLWPSRLLPVLLPSWGELPLPCTNHPACRRVG